MQESLPHPQGTPDVKAGSTNLIVCFMWIIIVIFSIAVGQYAAIGWYVMIIHYFLILVSFYMWHWQCHNYLGWNKKCYEMHKRHHWEVYPPSDYFGVKNAPSKDKTEKLEWQTGHDGYFTAHEIFLHILILIQAVATWYLTQNVKQVVFFLVEAGLIALVGTYLHQSFHIKGHFLEKFDWFHELRGIHYIHHLGTAQFNYAVFNLGIDRLFGTEMKSDPVADRRKQINMDVAVDQFLESEKNLNIDKEIFKRALRTSAATSGALFMNMNMSIPSYHSLSDVSSQQLQIPAWKKGISVVFLRGLIIGILVFVWIQIQRFIQEQFKVAGQMDCKSTHSIYDVSDSSFSGIFAVFKPLYYFSQRLWGNHLQAISFMMNASFVFMAVYSLVGRTVRPVVAVFWEFMLRLIINLCTIICSPSGSVSSLSVIWGNYALIGDQLFSGIVAFITIALVEFYRIVPVTSQQGKILKIVFVVSILSYLITILIGEQLVWSSSIALGVLVGRYCSLHAVRYVPYVDAFLP